MRVFIGIELDYEVRDYLKAVQGVIKHTAYEGNFTNFDNFHITIQFIGETLTSDLDHIEDIIETAFQNTTPFTIKIGDIGFFKRGRKKLVYVKVTEGSARLKHLHQTINQALKENGVILKPQKFTPHITIAREVILKDYMNTSIPMPLLTENVLISTITLFQSSRVLGKLTYTPLYRFELPR